MLAMSYTKDKSKRPELEDFHSQSKALKCIPNPNDLNSTDSCLACLEAVKYKYFPSKVPCLPVRLLSCLLYQTNCSVLDWLDLLQVNKHFTMTNQARA
jgi:hypothetical protein